MPGLVAARQSGGRQVWTPVVSQLGRATEGRNGCPVDCLHLTRRKERAGARPVSRSLSPHICNTWQRGTFLLTRDPKIYANHPFPTIREIDPEKPAKNNIQPYFLQQPRLGFWPGASSISPVQH